MTGADLSIHDRQFYEVSLKQANINASISQRDADQQRKEKAYLLDALLRIGNIVCPEKLEKLRIELNVTDLANAPHEELFMTIRTGANLLKLSALGGRTSTAETVEKLGADLESAKQSIAMERRRANEAVQKCERLQQELKDLQYEMRKSARKDKSHPQPDEQRVRGGEQRVENKPVQHESRLDENETGTINLDTIDHAGDAGTQSRPEYTTPQKQALKDATAEWKALRAGWKQSTRELFEPLIIHIGKTGQVTITEILASLVKHDKQLIFQTLRKRMDTLVEENILRKRTYALRYEDRSGRPESAYELTLLGIAAYRLLTAEVEVEPRDVAFIRHDKSPGHGKLISDIEAILSKWYTTKTAQDPMMLPGGRQFSPDIIFTDFDGSSIYLEVETPKHISTKDLHAKWRNAVEAGGGKVYLAMETSKEAERLGYSALRNWSFEAQYPGEIELFVTGRDYLESLNPPKSSRVNIWSARKVIRPTKQKEMTV